MREMENKGTEKGEKEGRGRTKKKGREEGGGGGGGEERKQLMGVKRLHASSSLV